LDYVKAVILKGKPQVNQTRKVTDTQSSIWLNQTKAQVDLTDVKRES